MKKFAIILLIPPVNQYLMGKSPSHSSTVKLGTHYSRINLETMLVILGSVGAVNGFIIYCCFLF